MKIKYCRKCGNQIPQDRLNAAPTTSFCIGCASGNVSRKVALTELVGGEEHGYTSVEIVSEDQLEGYVLEETRDIADVEPDQFAKDPRIPLSIKKRQDTI